MHRHLSLKFAGLIALIWISTLSFGCQGTLPTSKGNFVAAPQRVPISEGMQPQIWRTDDLSIHYQYTKSGDQLEISGKIDPSSSLVLNFQTFERFHLGVLLLDAQGEVLASDGLVTAGFRRNTDEPIQFQDTISLPQGTTALAFRYAGKACSAGNQTCTQLWHYPAQ